MPQVRSHAKQHSAGFQQGSTRRQEFTGLGDVLQYRYRVKAIEARVSIFRKVLNGHLISFVHIRILRNSAIGINANETSNLLLDGRCLSIFTFSSANLQHNRSVIAVLSNPSREFNQHICSQWKTRKLSWDHLNEFLSTDFKLDSYPCRRLEEHSCCLPSLLMASRRDGPPPRPSPYLRSESSC